MKKLDLKKLEVKSFVTSMEKDASNTIKGGWSEGCMDGCTGSAVACTEWNCTRAACSNDCQTLQVCDTVKYRCIEIQ